MNASANAIAALTDWVGLRRWRRGRSHRPLSRETVVWAYRLFLGRDPENDEVIDAATLYPSREDLVRAFLASAEFRSRGLPGWRQMDPFAGPLDAEWQVAAPVMDELRDRMAVMWERLGRERPHWSVLAGPEHLPENIAAHEQAFYDGGDWDLRMLLATLTRVGRSPAEFDLLFEFGCGTGRVTHHLSRHFHRVVACDISSSHLALARQALIARGVENVRFTQATRHDFGMSEPYDLWFSRLVLQHNPPPVIAAILDRALSLLQPRGLAVFQVPVYAPGYRFSLDEYRRVRDTFGPFEMHALPQSAVLGVARRANCQLIELRDDDSAGDPWISQFFTFEKL